MQMFCKFIFIIAFTIIGVFAKVPNDIVKRYCEMFEPIDKVEQCIKCKTSINNLTSCLSSVVDFEKLLNEIEESRANHTLNEVVKKYCSKSTQLKGCLESLRTVAEACNINNDVESFIEVNNHALDYICENDGSKIVSFYTENGPECLSANAEKFRACVRAYLEKSSSEIHIIMHSPERTEFMTCIVNAFKECSSPSPVNMVETFVQHINNAVPSKE